MHRSTLADYDFGVGINFCFAKLLLSHSCNVLIADLALRPEAQQLVDAHSAQDDPSKARAVFVKTDVVNFDQLAHMFEVADREFGGADIVCPGAGVFEPHWSNFWHPPGTPESRDTLHGTTTEGLGHYATLDINLTHPIRCTQLAMSKWLSPSSTHKQKVSASNPKRVVLVSSIAGQVPSFSAPLYVASKHAINGFIRSLARLEPTLGIRVNGVAPGLIRTPIWMEHPEKLRMIDQTRDIWVEPEEVAQGMLRCLIDEDIKGGSVMEILKGTFRNVDWKGDPGPQGPGANVSSAQILNDEVFQWLAQPGWGLKP
nr:15-hydroxyprostaglandin dehydrogenase [nad(+)] [Quercus suber]